jgi:hypothetical protein
MGSLYIVLLRIIIAIALAFVISLLFFKGISIIKIFGLAAIMFVLAYLFEFTRKRDKRED